MFDTRSIRKRFKAITTPKSLLGWIPLLSWLWRRVGDAYDIADTFALFERLWRGAFMSSILTFIESWGWLIGIAWLTGLVLWPSGKQDGQQKLDTEQERLRLADMQVENLTALCESYKKEAAEKEQHLQSLKDELGTLKKYHGMCIISVCGDKTEPLNLYVAVQFIDWRDADVAKQINAYFGFGAPYSKWKTKQVENIKWIDNPDSPARIVVFSRHGNAYRIKQALQDYGLLGEAVGFVDRGLAADITIVIFPKKGYQERPSGEGERDDAPLLRELGSLTEAGRFALGFILSYGPVTPDVVREHLISKGIEWSVDIPPRLERVFVSRDFAGQLSIKEQNRQFLRDELDKA